MNLFELGVDKYDTELWRTGPFEYTSYFLQQQISQKQHLQVYLKTSKSPNNEYISSQIYQSGPNDTTLGYWEFTSFEEMTTWIVEYFSN